MLIQCSFNPEKNLYNMNILNNINGRHVNYINDAHDCKKAELLH